MIESFVDGRTAALYDGRTVKGLQADHDLTRAMQDKNCQEAAMSIQALV